MRSTKIIQSLILLALLTLAHCYVQFAPVQLPDNDESKASITSSKKVTYGKYSIHSFNKIARTSESHNCLHPSCPLFGTLLSIQNLNMTVYDPQTLEDVVVQVKSKKKGKTMERKQLALSHYPSGGILMQEYNTDVWFMLYQFEKPNPGMIYRVRMRLEDDTTLASKLTVPISFGNSGGLWKPSSSSITPSSTYLGTESTGPDAMYLETSPCLYHKKKSSCLYDVHPELYYDVLDFMRYYNRSPLQLLKDGVLELPASKAIPGFKPYRFGYPFHIEFDLGVNDRVIDVTKKLYALGRVGAAGIATMQNGQTIYMSGGVGGFFKFNDDFGDYNSGELFAAVIKLDSKKISHGSEVHIKKGDVLKLEWISLGKREHQEILEYVSGNSTIVFSDVMKYAEPENGYCDKKLEYVNIGENAECIGVENRNLAGVLEPVRYGAVLGATMNIFKFSQIATRLDSDKFYVTSEKINDGYLRLNKGKSEVYIHGNKCGCVFEVEIDKKYDAVQMTAITCGVETEDEDNSCSTEHVANPRSLTFLNTFESLLIGEASDFRVNNFIWSYDYTTMEISRIFHAPKEGKITSVNWNQEVMGGGNYITMTISSPYDVFAWMGYFGSLELDYTKKHAFSSVPVPYAPGPKELPIGFRRITTGFSEVFDGFKSLISTGEKIKSSGKSKILFGELVDISSKSLNTYKQGPVRPEVVKENEVVHKLGYSSLLMVCDNIYSVSVVSAIPSTAYIIGIDAGSKKEEYGALNVAWTEHIDFSAYGGLWKSGGGTISPWGTHIGGEINEPDGLDYTGYPCLTGFSSCFKSRAEEAFQESLLFVRYYGKYLDDFKNDFEALAKFFNPYKYGFAYEIKVSKEGCVLPTKLMTLGRFSHGDIVIMPDRQTVYMTDLTEGKHSGGGLFKFIATKAGDLTAGTLYAAKFNGQKKSLDQYEIEWIKLAGAANEDLVKLVDKISFNDIFNYIPTTKTCRLSQINVKSSIECLEVKDKMELAAAFFETRRYAALVGATVELGNVKGIAYDEDRNKVYLSISRISSKEKIMLQDDNDGSANHIKLQHADCGSIYTMSVDKKFNIVDMDRVFTGDVESGTNEVNKCNKEVVSSPAQMAVVPGHGSFIVTEEACVHDATSGASCTHENAAMWNVDSFNLNQRTRIMTAPFFSSISAPTWHSNINDNTYISLNVNELYDQLQNVHDSNNPKATFGYMGPLFMNENSDTINSSEKSSKICYEKIEKGAQCPNSKKY